MDIMDIMLARAMTPQGQTDTYVAKANAAAAKAAKAQEDAEAAVATVTAAAEDIASAKDAADTLLEEAQTALETVQSAQLNVPELYTTTGQNTDGAMTQKAVTDALASKADASALAAKADASALANKLEASDLTNYATKTYVDNALENIPAISGEGTNINLGTANAGKTVVVGNNGRLTASDITEQDLINLLFTSDIYAGNNTLGIEIDYDNKTCTRLVGAANKTMGTDFNSFSMYGGRRRCNVSDDGTINAFYGEEGYTEDGSNGQVMIYQPKFYYKRIIRTADELAKGKVIRHEALIISATEQPGFKLAPVFNGDLDYILLPAYDAAVVDNKLTSIAGVKPKNYITRDQAEAAANARGTGWHIMNMAAESANQMLEMVEFGTMNGQAAIEEGITYIPTGSNGNGMFITGSTASLGNGTGHAETTVMDVDGTRTNQTENGKRAITYRGMENPWGNLWSMIGGVTVNGNGTEGGGKVYICKDFNYSGNNYGEVGFNLPTQYGWINAMGYGSDDYDWVYLPIECSSSANSYAPVGDYLWTVGGLNGTMIMATGGSFGYTEDCGPFYYAADRTLDTSSRNNYGAKLLFIPTKNNIYTANIAKWTAKMEG